MEENDDNLEYEEVLIGVKLDKELGESITRLLENAIEDGFPIEHSQKLKDIVTKYDVWRLELGADPPACVPPLRLQLKPGSVPYRTKARKYSPHLREFLNEFNGKLEKFGWIFENNNSRWSSPAYPVLKSGKSLKYRQTIDYRPVNQLTEPLAGIMPILPVIMEHVKGAKHFGTFDFINGFWQLPLHRDSQEILSFVTHEKVYTPTRVPQGCMDAPIYFQKTMETCFDELLYKSLLIWIDDLLLYSEDIEGYLHSLDILFSLLDKFKLKLSVEKSKLYQKSVKWCGRIVDGSGIAHDPARIETLIGLPTPTNAGELQELLCATNWMRDSIPNYAQVVAPLQQLLDTTLRHTKRTKRIAAGLSIQFNEDLLNSLTELKTALTQCVKLEHMDDNYITCVFSDASERGWGLIVSQIAERDRTLPIAQHHHRLVACLSGTFVGSQRNWSIIEKEAYPIVHACDRLSYLLHRPSGFHLFCDHRNLIYVFNPTKETKKHVKGKLLRWAMKLAQHRYVIEHVSGIENVWADILSRWGSQRQVFIKRMRTRSMRNSETSLSPQLNNIRPLDSEGFEWPKEAHIRQAQEQYKDKAPLECTMDDEGFLTVQGKLWIPVDASELVTRLMIIAHCGPQGHRGVHATMMVLQYHFHISNLQKHVQGFLRRCLLCLHVKGGKIIPRPWSETIRSTRRNEILHLDFLYMGESHTLTKYLLVIKDDASHFTELVMCDSPTSEIVVDALLMWQSRFGLPDTIITDNGSHFYNEMVALLIKKLKRHHTFVPAYSPWINGSIERVNRDILQVIRVMILEYKLSHRDWTYFIPLIQSNLNHTVVKSLAGYSPSELFTGLPRSTPLSTIKIIRNGKREVIDTNVSSIKKFLTTLRQSIQLMHKEMSDQRLKQTLLNKKRQRGEHLVNFTVGDYVLRSRVDEKHYGKLLVTWVGPYVITRANKYSFTVKHLLTGNETDVHASRLKFYADSNLEVTEELQEHVASQGIILCVDELLEHRWNNATNEFEILVSWKGLESIENSWEPLISLYKDIPVLVERYIKQAADTTLSKCLKQHS